MLFNDVSNVQSIVDNIGATITDAGLGTAVTSGGSTHTKGTPVSLIAGSLVTEDVYGVGIIFCGGNSPNSIRRYLADLLVDSNGGSSWDIKINNLFVNNPSLICGGYRYFFPLYLKAGTSIGMQQQCNLANTALRVGVQLYGKPNHPELYNIGNIVETFGAVTGSTSGTAITPGTSVVGAYTSIGTSVRNLWWWQWGGIGYNESVFSANCVLGDVAGGDGINFKICIDNCTQNYTAAEQAGKDALGFRSAQRRITGGTDIYVRASCSGTPETTPTTTAYGMA